MQARPTKITIYTEVIVDVKKGTVSLPISEVAGLSLNGAWKLEYQKKARSTRSGLQEEQHDRLPRSGRALTRLDFALFAK
jgi:hypothetical protein